VTSENGQGVALTGSMSHRYNGALMAGGRDRQDAWSGMGAAWAIITTLLAGILVWGGLGYVLDRQIGTSPVFLLIGMLLGGGVAIYVVIKRYGTDDASTKGKRKDAPDRDA
jgi:F0F1-type ATP synthase assembly protein I